MSVYLWDRRFVIGNQFLKWSNVWRQGVTVWFDTLWQGSVVTLLSCNLSTQIFLGWFLWLLQCSNIRCCFCLLRIQLWSRWFQWSQTLGSFRMVLLCIRNFLLDLSLFYVHARNMFILICVHNCILLCFLQQSSLISNYRVYFLLDVSDVWYTSFIAWWLQGLQIVDTLFKFWSASFRSSCISRDNPVLFQFQVSNSLLILFHIIFRIRHTCLKWLLSTLQRCIFGQQWFLLSSKSSFLICDFFLELLVV